MDVDAAKVEALRARRGADARARTAELLDERRAARVHHRYAGVLDAARLLFCCVDTPPTYSGDADLSRVQAVVANLRVGRRARAGHEEHRPRRAPGAAIRRDAPGLAYVSCPEFLKEGSAVQDFMHPDRVVVGADPGDEWAADAVDGALPAARRGDGAHRRRPAEMIKLASNAFLATKISFINEIANVCEEVGADVDRGRPGHGARRAHRPAVPAGRGSASAAAASPRTSRRSSSSPATPATTSSC